jgi:hypothetical protein
MQSESSHAKRICQVTKNEWMRKLFFADKKHHEQQAKLAFPTTEKHSAAGLNLAWNIHMHSISFWPAQPENEAMCIFYQKQILLAMPTFSFCVTWNILSSRECSGWGREHYRVAIAAGSTSERLNNAITRCLCVRSVAGEHHLRAGCRSAGKLGPRKCIIPSNLV